MKTLQKLKISKKLMVTFLTALLVTANETYNLGLSMESVAAIVTIAVSYILGQTAVDRKAIEKGRK